MERLLKDKTIKELKMELLEELGKQDRWETCAGFQTAKVYTIEYEESTVRIMVVTYTNSSEIATISIHWKDAYDYRAFTKKEIITWIEKLKNKVDSNLADSITKDTVKKLGIKK